MRTRSPFFPVKPTPHPFRLSLPTHVVTVAPEAGPDAPKKKQGNEDVRLFLLSFTAFFVAFSTFIW